MTDPLAREIVKALEASLDSLPADLSQALAQRRARALKRPRQMSWAAGALAASFLLAVIGWQQLSPAPVAETELNALSLLETEPQMLEDMDMLLDLGEAYSDS